MDHLVSRANRRPRRGHRNRLAAVVLIAVAGALAGLPGGCGGERPPASTTIHFVTWKPNIPEAWEEIYRLFREEHPEITVVTEVGPHSSSSFHDMLTQKLKNRSDDVDVFLMDVIWPPEFAAAGWALPLDERLEPAERRKFLRGALLAGTYKDKIYGLPLFVDSGVLFYRKDLLAKYGHEPPSTWEDLVRQAEQIVAGEAREGNEIWGYAGQFKQYEGLVCNMQEFILSNRGAILDAGTGRVTLADPPAVEAVRFVRDRVIGRVAPRGVLTYQEPESLDLFLQGKAVFLRSWPYAWAVSGDPERSRVAGRVGIALLPHFAGGESFSTLGGWQVGIASHSPRRDAAWTFAKFLASPKIQTVLATSGGRAPARTALYREREILETNPQFTDLMGVFLSAYPRPRSPLYPAISNALQRYFSAGISGAAADLQAEAEATSREIERIVALTR